MGYSKADIIRMVKEEDVQFIRMQFTDIFGQLKNVAITASQIEKAVDNQIMIDGSSIEGFVRINNNAATIADNTRPYLWLWGLTALYMCTAIAAQMLIERRENRKRTQCAGSSQVD